MKTREELQLKYRRNEVFGAIQERDLDPREFDWKEELSVKAGLLIHSSTDEFFRFYGDGAASWSKPGTGGQIAKTSYSSDNWSHRFSQFKEWLDAVKLWVIALHEYDSTPDLWAIIAQEREIANALDSSELGNEPFSKEEQQYIADQLQELKWYKYTWLSDSIDLA